MLSLNKIYEGNALELVKQLDDQSIDFLLWDPDYGVGMDYGGEQPSRDEAIEFVYTMLQLLRPKVKGQAVLFWSGSIERTRAFVNAGFDDLGWPIHYHGIWYKPNGAGPSGCGLARRFEPWYWMGDGKKGKAEWRFLPDVLSECRITIQHKEACLHPSQKPEKLLRRLIRFFTLPGAVILDPTIGSGSAAVACVQTGRQFIGFERNPEYIEMCSKRLAAAQPELVAMPPVEGQQLELV